MLSIRQIREKHYSLSSLECTQTITFANDSIKMHADET